MIIVSVQKIFIVYSLYSRKISLEESFRQFHQLLTLAKIYSTKISHDRC